MTNSTDVKTIQATLGHELMHAIYGAINGYGEASETSMGQALNLLVDLIKQVIEDEDSLSEIMSPITPPEE